MRVRSAAFLLAFLSLLIANAAPPAAPLFPVKQGGKWGLVDRDGKIVLPFQYDSIFYHDTTGYFNLEVNHRHGLADANGKIILPVRYVIIGPRFDHNGRIDVCTGAYIGDRCGLVDRSNTMRLPPIYHSISEFDGGKLYVVDSDKGLGVINIDNGAWVLRPGAFEFIGDLAKNGLAWAETSGNRMGFIDATGRWIIPLGRFDEVMPFDDYGLAVAIEHGKYGFIDRSGRWVIPPRWSIGRDIPSFGDNGLAVVGSPGKYVYIDRTGKVVIPRRFEVALNFENGWASVEVGGKWGEIDTAGRFVLAPRYDDSLVFSAEGVAVATVGGRSWFIDRQGRKVLGDYDKIGGFRDGWAAVKLHGKWGAIDTHGEWLLPPIYACVGSCWDE